MLFYRRMLFRELKREYAVLLASLLPIVVGVALIVSLGSLREQVLGALSNQEREILGADLSISIRGRTTTELREIVDRIPGKQTKQVSFPSMLLSKRSGLSKLVQVKGLSGEFPFYGSFETQPPEASLAYLDPSSLILEQGAASQIDAQVGDQLELGDSTFTLAGIVTKVPGSNELRSGLAPSVFALESALKEAGLLDYGIRQRTTFYYAFPSVSQAEKIYSEYSESIEALGAKIDTPATKRQNLGKTISKVYEYLNLFGVSALLFGVLGAASGGMQYARSKRRVSAVLKCIGANSRQLITLYGFTFVFAAFLASLVGTLVSIPLLKALHLAFDQFFVGESTSSVVPALGLSLIGLAIGTVFSLLFALPPLFALRSVSPVDALQEEVKSKNTNQGLGLGVIVILAAGSFLLSSLLGTSAKLSALFSAGLIALILVQLFLSWAARHAISKLVGRRVWFSVRQGIFSLKRPGSETLFLSTIIGLPFFIVVTLLSLASTLGEEITTLLTETKENVVFFDVQADQENLVAKLAKEHGVELLGTFPLISMRIESLKGLSARELREEAASERTKWYLSREYRNTIRPALLPNEKMISGTIVSSIAEDFVGRVPVTIESRMAGILEVSVGDDIVFDIQGVLVPTVVSGVRKFDWRSINPGFFVVFPEGSLQNAPYFSVITAFMKEKESLPKLQRAVSERASNISIIDSSQILDTIRSVFSRLGTVVQVVGYSIFASALLVLFSTLFLSKESRQHEYKVYDQLGASRTSIRLMGVSEFFFIGLISCAGAALVSIVFNFISSKYLLNLETQPSVLITLVGVAITLFALVCISLFQTRKRKA